MKKILFLLVVMILMPRPAEGFYFSFGFGNGKTDDKKECCTPVSKKIPKATKRIIYRPKKNTIRYKVKKRKTNIKRKQVKKVKKSLKKNKRDWVTLTTNNIGAFGITYGARKSDWLSASIGAGVLVWSLLTKRNTNSTSDQVLSIGAGTSLGFLPKKKKETSSNTTNPSPNPLPLPPTP
jgi:hypothetical protein